MTVKNRVYACKEYQSKIQSIGGTSVLQQPLKFGWKDIAAVKSSEKLLDSPEFHALVNKPCEDDDVEAQEVQKNVIEYLKALSLCHTVTIDNSEATPKYTAASPDELAFIEFAKKSGMEFKKIDS